MLNINNYANHIQYSLSLIYFVHATEHAISLSVSSQCLFENIYIYITCNGKWKIFSEEELIIRTGLK